MIIPGEYYLITTNAWFIAPDGEEYRGAWGKCKVDTTENVFGFTPTRPSTNWYCIVGDGDNSIVIAGCQIHYAVRCKTRPAQKMGTFKLEATKSDSPLNRIYFTE